MRYAVLSDIHANQFALEAVLADADRAGVDGYLCLGDTIGYGPAPSRCLHTVQAIGATAVAGNHEMLVLGRLPLTRATSLAARSIVWTRSALDDAELRAIAALPETATVGAMMLAHGAPGDAQEYVRTEARATELLTGAGTGTTVPQLLLLGHTHEQWAFAFGAGTSLRGRPGDLRLVAGQRYLLNPGSVGQSRDHRAEARYLVLDTEGCASFRSLRYDVAASRRALREAGLPAESVHIRPPRLETVRRRLKRVLGLLTGRR